MFTFIFARIFISVLGLEATCPRKLVPWLWIFWSPWPWPRRLCPHRHLCKLAIKRERNIAIVQWN